MLMPHISLSVNWSRIMHATSATLRRVAILGAGPIGLEAAHALIATGFEVDVYERGQVGQSVQDWGHVHLFSPWSLNMSPLGRTALTDQGIALPPETDYPTGHEYVRQYLAPLAQHPRLHGRIHLHTKVIQVGRHRVLKAESISPENRQAQPFRLLLSEADAQERIAYADIVVDTTGCYTHPNHLGDGGIPAPGERHAAEAGRIWYQLPDMAGPHRERFAGRHTVVVGTGYSAITTISNLLTLSQVSPGTCVTWCTRKLTAPYHHLDDDPLPERIRLVELGNRIAAGAHADTVTYLPGVSVDRVIANDQGPMALELLHVSEPLKVVTGIDEIVAHVGFRPDLSLYRELLIHQCYASEGPMQLAAALLASAGASADCLAQTSAGPATLLSPEPDFFILGAKSYGRGSNFLIKLGLEQIQDVLTLLHAELEVTASSSSGHERL